MAVPVLQYSADDFVTEVPVGGDTKGHRSKFDEELQSRWDDAMDKGYFRYQLGDLTTKILPGPHHYIAQLNVKRATERRKPQEIKSTKQPFNPDQFNFTKIRQHEILMELRPRLTAAPPLQNGISHCAKDEHDEEKGESIESRGGRHLIVINISPLEYCHILLVPQMEACQPQIATREMIQLGVETVLLSSTRTFKIGYNSLCAFASVNHLHMHAYYTQYKVPVEDWPTKEVVPDRCHELEGWPARIFVLKLRRENYKDVVSDCYAIVKLFQDKDIAHNMFFTRGCTLGPHPKDDGKTIRLLVWPRKSVYGVKDEDAFNAAVCELAGHLPIKSEESFKNITDDSASSLLREHSLTDQEFEDLTKDVKNVLTQSH